MSHSLPKSRLSASLSALPLKTWKDCLRCPMFQACDEVALAYMVTPGAEVYMGALPPEEAPTEGVPLLPILGAPRTLAVE